MVNDWLNIRLKFSPSESIKVGSTKTQGDAHVWKTGHYGNNGNVVEWMYGGV